MNSDKDKNFSPENIKNAKPEDPPADDPVFAENLQKEMKELADYCAVGV